MSTAFPQPAPGTAPSPGPMKVEPDRLKSVLGLANVTYLPGRSALAVVDATLGAAPADPRRRSAAPRREHARPPSWPTVEIGIDNFSFKPPSSAYAGAPRSPGSTPTTCRT